LLNIEGLGRELYPELDLWKTAKPYMERWMRQQVGVASIARRIKQELPLWGERLPELPARLNQALEDMSAMRAHMGEQTRQIQRLHEEVRNRSRFGLASAIGAVCILSAFILLAGSGSVLEYFGRVPVLTWVLGGIGALLLLFAWPRR
jgi:ubiquinone biosynthesis protein